MDAVQVSCDIAYKTSDSGIDQTLNLYLPADTQSGDTLPAVIFFHGQDPAALYTLTHQIYDGAEIRSEPLLQQFQRDQHTHGLVVAASGMVGITFGYSGFSVLSDRVVPSAEAVGRAAQDALDLLAYVADHATELNVDPERICLWTTSWGSLTGAYAGLVGTPAPKCVVVFTGKLEWDVAGPYSPTVRPRNSPKRLPPNCWQLRAMPIMLPSGEQGCWKWPRATSCSPPGPREQTQSATRSRLVTTGRRQASRFHPAR